MRILMAIAILGAGCEEGEKSPLSGQKAAMLKAVKAGDFDAVEEFLVSPERMPEACRKLDDVVNGAARLRELTRERIAPCKQIDWAAANVLKERGGEVGDPIRDPDLPPGCELTKVTDLELRVVVSGVQWEVKALNDAFLADGKLLMWDPPKCELAVE